MGNGTPYNISIKLATTYHSFISYKAIEVIESFDMSWWHDDEGISHRKFYQQPFEFVNQLKSHIAVKEAAWWGFEGYPRLSLPISTYAWVRLKMRREMQPT